MPSADSELRQQVTALLKSGNLPFAPSQQKLSFPIIKRMCKKMEVNLQFPSIKVHTNLIIDGHHTYIASVITGLLVDSAPTIRSSAKVEFNWAEVDLVDEDWDSPDDVVRYNKEDAAYNGLTLEGLMKKLD